MIIHHEFHKQKEMSEFEARGIASYLNDLLEDMYGSKKDAEKLFGLVLRFNKLECIETPFAEWLLPDESDAIRNEYLVQRFWLTTNGVLMADIQHEFSEALKIKVRIN